MARPSVLLVASMVRFPAVPFAALNFANSASSLLHQRGVSLIAHSLPTTELASSCWRLNAAVSSLVSSSIFK